MSALWEWSHWQQLTAKGKNWLPNGRTAAVWMGQWLGPSSDHGLPFSDAWAIQCVKNAHQCNFYFTLQSGKTKEYYIILRTFFFLDSHMSLSSISTQVKPWSRISFYHGAALLRNFDKYDSWTSYLIFSAFCAKYCIHAPVFRQLLSPIYESCITVLQSTEYKKCNELCTSTYPTKLQGCWKLFQQTEYPPTKVL